MERLSADHDALAATLAAGALALAHVTPRAAVTESPPAQPGAAPRDPYSGSPPWGKTRHLFEHGLREPQRRRRTDAPPQAGTLNALALTACVANADRQLIYANSAGMALLQRGDVLTLREDGVLRACVSVCDEALRRAIAEAVRGHTGGLRLLDRDDRVAFHVAAVRLAPRSDVPRVLLAMTPAQPRCPLSAHMLRQMFDLSDAEASLALALAQGETAEQYARRVHRSLATVRTQLRALYAKTGATRLGELLLLLARLPAVGSSALAV